MLQLGLNLRLLSNRNVYRLTIRNRTIALEHGKNLQLPIICPVKKRNREGVQFSRHSLLSDSDTAEITRDFGYNGNFLVTMGHTEAFLWHFTFCIRCQSDLHTANELFAYNVNTTDACRYSLMCRIFSMDLICC